MVDLDGWEEEIMSKGTALTFT